MLDRPRQVITAGCLGSGSAVGRSRDERRRGVVSPRERRQVRTLTSPARLNPACAPFNALAIVVYSVQRLTIAGLVGWG